MVQLLVLFILFFFFFNDTATTEIYTLSLHDALPILHEAPGAEAVAVADLSTDRLDAIHKRFPAVRVTTDYREQADRKSTRLNSSHLVISYAVFCLKKKKKNTTNYVPRNIPSQNTAPV